MQILIAEDDLTSRGLLAGVLGKEGYSVIEVDNGEDALKILCREASPKLAIIDWVMPGLSGIEVLARVREVETNNPPYIIMLTHKDNKEDIIAGLDAGANDYLVKPFDPGEMRARIGVGKRMTELQDALVKTQEELAYQANHDPLTGLLNRRTLFDRLYEDISRISRSESFLAVGMCDIDHFKEANDTHGHLAGDDVLVGIAAFLKEELRPYDAIGRIGGEEFLVAIATKSKESCVNIFERIRERLASTPISTRNGPIPITISIGVAITEGEDTVDSLLEVADKSLYQAKAEGRNRVVVQE